MIFHQISQSVRLANTQAVQSAEKPDCVCQTGT